MIYFNYKNKKYSLFFWSGGLIAEVARIQDGKPGKVQRVSYGKETKLKDFLCLIDSMKL